MQTAMEFDDFSGEAAEYQTRENKKSLSEERAGIETIAAFATAQGGILRFGRAPNGERFGAQLGANTLENLARNIKQYTEPPQFPTITVEGPQENCVVTVRVEESPIKPVFAYGTAFKRVGRANQKLSREEVQRLMDVTRRSSWDAMTCPDLEVSQLDRGRIEAFLRRADVAPFPPNESVLRSLSLMNEAAQKPVNATALLFTKKAVRPPALAEGI